MMSHTAGPWNSRGRYVMDEHENVLAQTQMDDGAFTLQEAKKNARLIAAAPELLEAVKALVDTFQWTDESLGQADAIKSAIATIAKAEGK